MRSKYIYLVLILCGALMFGLLLFEYYNESRATENVKDSKNKKSRLDGAGADDQLSRRDARIDFLIGQLDGRSAILGVDERINVARELNRVYFDARSNDVRKKISDALTRSLRLEQDAQVARAITFSHSRLYFDENTLPNLKLSYERKYIYFDDYYGELAHLYDEAPSDIRKEIIGEISRSNSRYAVDIVSAKIALEDGVRLSDQEIDDFQNFLKKNRPIFGGSNDSFGYFEAIFYNQWLIAVSRLQHQSEGGSVEKWLGRRLLDPATDPRACVAFLISPYAKSLDASKKAEVQWDAVRARAQELMLRYPKSPGLQEIGKEMAQ